MRVYLAGPMRGYPDLNHHAFHNAAAVLRERGHRVCNPAEIAPKDLRVRDCLAIDLSWICNHTEAVVLLPGWNSSLGAIAEVAAATAIGIPHFGLDEFLRKTL